MSKPTRWALVCAAFIAACALVLACAKGGATSGDDMMEPMDAPASTQQDANVSTMTDAPAAKMDGSVVPTPDAAAPQPDAPPNSLFCSSNAQCTVAGECCFAINGQGFCVPGTVILNVCFPQ
jgi:hypothetical protein